jgi:hypothetical protein
MLIFLPSNEINYPENGDNVILEQFGAVLFKAEKV